ncbi:MAG: aminodeoxychorismate synthase component I [Pseudomonadota bacterium]|nr:aminodeoxychorismate synthase component I [Pseudomonadota bacterium]
MASGEPTEVYYLPDISEIVSVAIDHSGKHNYSIHLYPNHIDLLDLSSLNSDRYPFLLQSTAIGRQGRYDILFAFPQQTLTLKDDGSLSGPYPQKKSFLDSLDACWASSAVKVNPEQDIPFSGGWFIYLGYELAGEIEPELQFDVEEGIPIAFATRVPTAIIFDRQKDQIKIVAEQGYENELAEIIKDLNKLKNLSSVHPKSANVINIEEDAPDDYLNAVHEAKRYIKRGDIYQANLSRRWKATAKKSVEPTSLYARLRETNPSPFSALVSHADFTLISSSPERLVRRRGAMIDTRPIAGTSPNREINPVNKAAQRALLESEKDQAEHVMLIDLERNDLGKICKAGSVHVNEFMTVESYRHVHHIVSNVSGRATPGLTPGDLIRAVFPGGTITGCPKIRCMQIIRQLEGRSRNAYTGSIGFIDNNGNCDFNILIRTMIVRGREISLDAGSGIVSDSEPIAELNETRAKAKGLLLALNEE